MTDQDLQRIEERAAAANPALAPARIKTPLAYAEASLHREFVSDFHEHARQNIAALVAEVRRLWARERQLLEANNAEVEKRRRYEAEANQEHVEKILLRNECMRLRENMAAIGDYLDTLAETIPPELDALLEQYFPEEKS